MWDLPVVKLGNKKARRLADLTGIYMDLSFTIDACKLLMELVDHRRETDRDGLLREALWSSALVAYARAFAPGRRYGLGEGVFSKLESNYLTAHRLFISLRNKHVAHSVNPFEQAEVGLALSEEGVAERKVEAIVVFAIRLANLNKPAVIDLHNLAATLRNEVGRLAEGAKDGALEDAKAVPADDLYRAPRLQVRVPHVGDVKKVDSAR